MAFWGQKRRSRFRCRGALTLGPHLAKDGIQDEVNLPLEPKEGIRAALSVRHRQTRASQDVVAKFRNWASKFLT